MVYTEENFIVKLMIMHLLSTNHHSAVRCNFGPAIPVDSVSARFRLEQSVEVTENKHQEINRFQNTPTNTHLKTHELYHHPPK